MFYHTNLNFLKCHFIKKYVKSFTIYNQREGEKLGIITGMGEQEQKCSPCQSLTALDPFMLNPEAVGLGQFPGAYSDLCGSRTAALCPDEQSGSLDASLIYSEGWAG